MRIICVDNFNRDHIPDEHVASNLSPAHAELIAALLNLREKDDSPKFFKAVEDNYVLKKASFE